MLSKSQYSAFFLVAAVAFATSGVVAAARTSSFARSSSSSSSVPLGDGKYDTKTAKRGYIFLCNARKDGGGAMKDGPWIGTNTWDPSKKIAVNGSVSWPKASFKMSVSGENRTITTNALPSHVSGIFPIAKTDPAYVYDRNPNSIASQSISLTLPANPVVNATPTCMGGEVGIALTGVPIFNGFDAELRDAAAHELQDAYSGHPQAQSEYHYHSISDAVVKALTTKDAVGPTLVGFAYDGFGIYGPTEGGKTLTNDDLDECHGHTGTVTWNGKQQKIYHYHATKEFPYTVGCFKGTPALTGPSVAGKSMQTRSSVTGATENGGPPQVAIDACSGKSTGDSCSFSDKNGDHSGTCKGPVGLALACAPAGR